MERDEVIDKLRSVLDVRHPDSSHFEEAFTCAVRRVVAKMHEPANTAAVIAPIAPLVEAKAKNTEANSCPRCFERPSCRGALWYCSNPNCNYRNGMDGQSLEDWNANPRPAGVDVSESNDRVPTTCGSPTSTPVNAGIAANDDGESVEASGNTVRAHWIPKDAIIIFKDGDSWAAVRWGFQNLQENHAGFGDTISAAVDALYSDESGNTVASLPKQNGTEPKYDAETLRTSMMPKYVGNTVRADGANSQPDTSKVASTDGTAGVPSSAPPSPRETVEWWIRWADKLGTRIDALEKEVAEARAANEELRCVFCEGIFPAQGDAWKDHLAKCPKHPMRALEKENAELKATAGKVERILVRAKMGNACGTYHGLKDCINDIIEIAAAPAPAPEPKKERA